MKLLIIGDSHGNIANLKHVMGFAKTIDAKVVIHTGDWNNLQSVETVLEYDLPLYSCLGNGDIDPDFKFQEFITFEIDGIKIGLTHKPVNVTKHFRDKDVDIVFCGHWHTKDESNIGTIRVVRPGALENGINFAIFDTKTKMVEFVNHDKLRGTSQT